jgi:uncharacterized membrane protein YdbT with pleckstrin-like domain
MKYIYDLDRKISNFLFQPYTLKNLVYGERLIFQSKKHWINFFNGWLVLIMIFSFFSGNFPITFLLVLINLIYLYITIKTDECIVTNKKVIFKTGFLSTNTIEMNLKQIESLVVEQTLLGKILGYGTVNMKGTGGTIETFSQINQPLLIRKKIQEVSF